jgi:multidrug efflux pump subunit AcrB
VKSAFEHARSRRAALVLLIAVLVAAGVYQAKQLPSAIFPSVTFPVIKVIADVGQERAAQMVPTTTRPLEQAILRVPGVIGVRSTTSRGSTEITAQFVWGTDMNVALQRVQSETQRVGPELPQNVKIDVEWMSPAKFPIQGYALTSDTRSEAELHDLAEYTLLPALVRVPGVAQVQIQGGRLREFEVRLDPVQLEGRHLAVSDVIDAVRRDDQVLSAGLTEKNHELYLTLVDGRVHDLAQLAAIAVPVPDGAPAKLGDLGEVTTADEVSYVRTTAGGKPAVLLNVLRQPSGSTVGIANAIDALVAEQPSLVPHDVKWSSFYDQAEFVSSSITGARDAILIGVALAALVLFAFLRSVRMTLVAVAAIPITVGVVALGLSAFGQTINLMTLAGVAAALGLIADDAIVVIEKIQSRIAAGDADPVAGGIREILPALASSSLSTTIIFLPFMLLGGVVGAFFKPLALTMALTLTVSFLLAWVMVPLFAAGRTSPHPPDSGERKGTTWIGQRIAAIGDGLGRGYDRSIALVVRHGWIAALATALLIGGAYHRAVARHACRSAGRAAPHRADAQHLELRRGDHDGRHRLRERDLRHPRGAARAARRGVTGRGVDARVSLAAPRRRDDDARHGACAGAAGDGDRARIAAHAATGDRYHRWIRGLGARGPLSSTRTLSPPRSSRSSWRRRRATWS